MRYLYRATLAAAGVGAILAVRAPAIVGLVSNHINQLLPVARF